MTKTILIAEDDPNNRKLFRDILRAAGYETLEAGNGAEALLLAGQRKPDLILMDIRMPVMDGLSAVRRLKADPVTRPIPVIVVSAFAMEKDQENALLAGCDGYMSKPFGIRDLRDRIRGFLAPEA
jgi:two-component system cell cycle response regulator DivK